MRTKIAENGVYCFRGMKQRSTLKKVRRNGPDSIDIDGEEWYCFQNHCFKHNNNYWLISFNISSNGKVTYWICSRLTGKYEEFELI